MLDRGLVVFLMEKDPFSLGLPEPPCIYLWYVKIQHGSPPAPGNLLQRHQALAQL